MKRFLKKIIFILFVAGMLAFCSHKPERTYIGGKIENSNEKYVYLLHDYFPFPTDSFRLDSTGKFGGYIQIDTPTTYLFLVGDQLHDIYIRPGDSLLISTNVHDFDGTLNFSGSKVARFNNLIKDLGNAGMEEIFAILPHIKKIDSAELVDRMAPFRRKKEQIIRHFEKQNPDWELLPVEQTFLDINRYMPELFLYERYNKNHSGSDTIHYTIPFPFDYKRQYPVNYFLHFWLTEKLLNKYAQVDFNNYEQARKSLIETSSMLGDPLLADFQSFKLIEHKIGNLYPRLDTVTMKKLKSFLDTIFRVPRHARYTANYIQMMTDATEDHIPQDFKLIHANTCDTLSLHQLLENQSAKLTLIMPIIHFDKKFLKICHPVEALRNKYNDQINIFYIYNREPPLLDVTILGWNPDYFYRIDPEHNFFGQLNIIYFHKPLVYVFDRSKTIRRIISPCKENVDTVVDSLLKTLP